MEFRSIFGRKILIQLILVAVYSQLTDSAVTFTTLPDTTSQAESIVVGTSVHTVAPASGTPSYTCSVTLQNPDDANRRFAFSALELLTTAALDFETHIQYNLTVECSDAVPDVASSLLTVDIQDVNDETPVISGTLSAIINEEEAIGTSVPNLFTATDADAGDVLSYALTGSDTAYFQVDSSLGTISVKTRLDRDSPSARVAFNQLTLVVTDAVGASDSVSLTVTLQDINDNTPTFSPSVYYVTVAENSALGASLVTITCSDPDETPGNGDITYSITSGDDSSAKFALSGTELQTTGNPIDYETLSGQNYAYRLTITGTDGGTPPNIGSATVIIQVTSENDNSPAWGTFSPAFVVGQSYNVTENASVGTSIVTVSATDLDDGIDGIITYSIDSIVAGGSSQPGVFRIDSVSGELATDILLDGDPPSGISVYTLDIRATDNGSPAGEVNRTLTITVLDSNDNPPSFAQSLYAVSMNEDEVTTTSVLTLVATDNDPSSLSLSYSILSGNTASKFTIQSGNELQIQTVIDLDSPSNDNIQYSLVVEVVDGGTPELTGSTTVIITITPLNDLSPVIQSGNYNVSVGEDSVVGATITTVTATDDDYGTHGDITYSISSGDTGNNFHINSASGLIKLIKAIDFDSLSVNPIVLMTVATDGGGLTHSTMVEVHVTDVNDNSPSCSASILNTAIDENNALGSDVQVVSCTDADSSDTLTYSISSGNVGSAFNISSTGQLQLLNLVNYESGTISYSLVIEASDGTYTVEVQVLVDINPINEFTPAFSPVIQNVTWAEDTATSTTLTTFTATDDDTGVDGDITYTIGSVSQSGGSKFGIDASSGDILLLTDLDYETLTSSAKYYVLIVRATDGNGLQGIGTLSIHVSDVNDNYPVCSQTYITVSHAENTAPGSITVLASLPCSDLDDGSFGTITYGMSQNPSGSDFSIDSATGKLVLITSLDFETTSVFTLTITVDDGGTPAKTTGVTVKVTVSNVNDGAPSFSGSFDTDIAESAALGQSVIDVTASDPDDSSTPEGNLAYSILSGDANNQFVIDGHSGRLSVNKQLDRESVSSYSIVVQAIEEAGTNSVTTVVKVNVTDVNDNTPACPNSVIITSLLETAAINYVIQTLACTDADGDAVSYSITSGDLTVFQISTNDLTLKSAVDFDAGTRSYDLIISATDGTNNRDIQVTVNIDPVNEGTPTFTSAGTYMVDVGEDESVGNNILSVIATDGDSTDTSHGQVLYSFVAVYPKFLIDGGSGVITLQSSLDREAVDTYTLLVEGNDGTLSSTATVVVNVTDVNDNDPLFSAYTYSGTVSEADVGGASVIVTVIASDADDPNTSNNGVVSYSIAGGNTGGVFSLDASTGEIITTASIDYDSLSNPYFSLTVYAVDRAFAAGSLTSSVVVTISVTSINDNDPSFTSVSFNASLSEDAVLGSLVTQVAATDLDLGVDGEIFYTISSSQPKFLLDSSTGQITLRDYLDYETDTAYTFDVLAKDRGSTPRSATVTVFVSVTDVNDNIPECTPSTDTVLLREDTALVSTIATLTCSDLDDGGSSLLSYNIYSVNAVVGNGPFQAMSYNALLLSSAFDYESTTSYSVIIHVVDGGSPALTSTVEIAVSISDVNEHDPNFTSLPYSTNVPENTVTGTSIYTVAATDGDSTETVTFSMNPTSSIFAVDPITGVINVIGPIDRESKDFYNLTLVAVDSGTVDSTRTVSTSVVLSITDTNDNAPIFNPGSYSDSLSENTIDGTTVVSLTATDGDIGSNGDITYSIISGDTNNVFRVDKHIPTGECKLIVDDATFLDYETTDSYSLVIRATDGGGLTTDANVYLTVTGYNDFTPTFTPSSSSTEYVTEDSAIDTVVIDTNATDSDLGVDGEITYSIATGAFGKFSIDPQSGVITVSGSLDAETTLVYNMDVIAVDGGTNPSTNTATYSLTVSVTDINDVSPVCSRSLYSSTLSESTSTVTSVSQLSCSDGDNGNPNNQLTYSIMSGAGSSLFQIDALGEVSTAIGASFDYETKTSYSLTINVADQGSPSLSTSVTLEVNIADENDNDPSFCCSPYSTSFGEEVVVDTSVLPVVATDADDTVYGTIVYSISTGNSEGKFAIDSSTGDIRTAANLDYEVIKAYNLTILASDLGSPARSGSATVSVDIVDYNDNAPVCTPAYYRSVAEDASVSHSVVTVDCSDADDGANAVVSYSLLPTFVPFVVGASTGQVDVSSALDAESQALYSLIAVASDGTFNYNVSVIVTITDVNEAAPAFNPTGPYSVSVNEDETIGSIVEIINVTDTDIADTTFNYVISSGNPNNRFQINPVSGIVRISSNLDYETNRLHELEITVSDGTDPSSRSSTTTLSVSVLDINDNAPVCSPESYFHTALESDTGTLLTLACSDVDTVSTTLTYTFISGNTNGDLSIGTNSGDISVTSALDFETTTSYDLVVEVIDGVLLTSVLVTVSVEGVNEFDPIFIDLSYGTTLSEDSSIGTTVIVVNGTDNDSGYDGILRYSITAGNSENKFAIEESTGRIKVIGLLNREQTSEYILTVRAADNLVGSVDERHSDMSVNITITDVNDNFPAFNPTSYFFKVSETAASGSTLLHVTASDDDVGINSDLVFSITGGNPGSIFIMASNAIEIAGGMNLDYESATYHTLTVQASDQGTAPKVTNTIVSIQVLPVNEFAPVFSSNGSVTIPEDTAVGTIILTALATDNDADTDGNIVYSITSGNSPGTPFYIDSVTGQLQVWSQLDFDIAPDTYTLEIIAQDRSGNITGLSSTMTFSVILTDVNDETPVFSLNSYYFTLEENVVGLTSVGSVIATDADTGVNGNVTFEAVTGDTNVFTVNAFSGEIQTAASASIDFEIKTRYSLVIKAIDSGTPQRSSQSTVFLTVTDLNDNAPVFQILDFTTSIYENATISTVVTTVVASDLDSGSNSAFTYSLVTSSPFAVHSTSGDLTTTGALDREATPSYTLIIKAIDQGSPAMTGTSTVTVSILDINDNVPAVSGVYDTTISEDTVADSVVMTVTATDLDEGVNADLIYSIESGNTNNSWKIETEAGIVQIANALDRETTASYHLVVLVSDKGSPVQTASVTLSLTVSDVNDNSPVFSTSPYSFNIAENVAGGSSVGRLTTTDADTGVNSAVQYQLLYFLVGTNKFAVDISTGEITTSGSLDRETTDRYVFVCRGYDNGSPQLSTEVQITVTVTDLNDNNPVFSATLYSGTVTENSVVGTSVLTVVFNDNDIGSNAAVALSIDTSTTDGVRADQLFALNSITGIMSVKQLIDRETDSSFTFTLYGKDGGSPSLNASASISVSVFDENDNAPIFTTSFLNKEVAFDGSCTSSITTVTAVDIDEGSNALVNYYIVQTGNNHLFSVGEISGDVAVKATAVAGTKYVIYVMAQDKGTTTRTSANNLAIRIDAFDPASKAISFTLSVSKAYFTTNEKSFVDGLTLVYNTNYPMAVVKTWCVEERDGQATDPSSGRRRLLATGDKPVTVHMYVLSDNTTDSVSNVGSDKNILSSLDALAPVADGSSPAAAITGSAWTDYGIVSVTEYVVTEDTTPWIQTAVGIAVVTCSVVAFLILLLLLIWCVVVCCKKLRKRPITPVRPATNEIVGPEEEKNNLKSPLKSINPLPTRGLEDLKKTLRPAILALPMPERRKTVNNDILIVNPPSSGNPILTREFDGMAVDPASGKLYEYNTRTKERRWLSTRNGKAVTANNLPSQNGSQQGNYNDV